MKSYDCLQCLELVAEIKMFGLRRSHLRFGLVGEAMGAAAWNLASSGFSSLRCMGQKWGKNGVNNYGDFWAKYGIKLIK